MLDSQTLLAFDFGKKRIGVAVGQTLTQTATPLTTLSANQGVPNWQQVKELVAKWMPVALVVGIPLNMDGSEQAITSAAREFAKALATELKLPVHETDERLSTVAAREHVFAAGGYKALQKTEIDSVAAQLILEHWMKGSEGRRQRTEDRFS